MPRLLSASSDMLQLSRLRGSDSQDAGHHGIAVYVQSAQQHHARQHRAEAINFMQA